MDQLEHGDEEWESLADRGLPPLRRDGDDVAAASPSGAASDPEWDSLVERLDQPRRGALAGARVKGWWRRLKGRGSEGRR